MKLPLEVIGHVINSTDDLQTLQSWACVNSATRELAERVLWRSIVVHCDLFGEDWELWATHAGPISTLKTEADVLANPEKWRDMDYFHNPSTPKPFCLRGAFIEALSLRARYEWKPDDDDADGGVAENDIRLTFKSLSPILVNLRSLRIDGIFSQRCWDMLLELPALKELRLWRTWDLNEENIDFEGLSRLQAFEIGPLYFTEAVALGTAVRESSLEKLHIAIKEDRQLWNPDMLSVFFQALVGLGSDDIKGDQSLSDEDVGFPSSLVELVIEDDYKHDKNTDPFVLYQKVFRQCDKLSCLYLDIRERLSFQHFLENLYLPSLTRLYLPLVLEPSQRLTAAGLDSNTYIIGKFIERHRETLTFFQVVATWEENWQVKELDLRLKPWFSVQEFRLDGGDRGHNDLLEAEWWEDWASAGRFLSQDCGRHWGNDLRRVRLDRFNLDDIDEDFEWGFDWEKINILILNPLLPCHYGLFPDHNESTSVHTPQFKKRQLIEPASPIQPKEPSELTIVGRLINKTSKFKTDLRVISVNESRFWIEPGNHRIWQLSDALEDNEQSVLIKRSLDARDWEFLSEQLTPYSGRAANNATFLRIDNQFQYQVTQRLNG